MENKTIYRQNVYQDGLFKFQKESTTIANQERYILHTTKENQFQLK